MLGGDIAWVAEGYSFHRPKPAIVADAPKVYRPKPHHGAYDTLDNFHDDQPVPYRATTPTALHKRRVKSAMGRFKKADIDVAYGEIYKWNGSMMDLRGRPCSASSFNVSRSSTPVAYVPHRTNARDVLYVGKVGETTASRPKSAPASGARQGSESQGKLYVGPAGKGQCRPTSATAAGTPPAGRHWRCQGHTGQSMEGLFSCRGARSPVQAWSANEHHSCTCPEPHRPSTAPPVGKHIV